jgi:ABC-type bacteriocin/lantibiotic exporter with double-glycine peptidase domain
VAENKISALTAFGRLMLLLGGEKKEIYYIYSYAIFNGLITLSIPLGIQGILGLINGGAISAAWVLVIIIVVLATLLSGILKVMQMIATENIQERIFAKAAFDFTFRIPRFNLEALSGTYPPELINRFFDIQNLQKSLPKILIDISSSILQIVFGLILLSFYHTFFIIFAAILIAILYLIFSVTGPMGLNTALKESNYKYKVAYWLEELARSLTIFKLASKSSLPLIKVDHLVGDYLVYRRKHFKILVWQFSSIVGFKVLITAGLLILGSILVVENQINIGQFVAAEIIILLVIESVEKLILTMDSVYDALTAVEKLGSISDVPLDKDGGIPITSKDGNKGISVTLNRVSYKYPKNDEYALQNINLSIPAGQKVIIAGVNGGGKTTLAKIFATLITEHEGVVDYNKFPLRNLEIESLRKSIAPFTSFKDIFEGTLEENISLGYDDISLENVIDAANLAGLDSFVQSIPDGYNTLLEPTGRNLARGILVRIKFARLIALKPGLIVLEDNFETLVYSEKQRLLNLIMSKTNPSTVVAISNDPFAMEMSDRIVLLDGGSIVADGTFVELKGRLESENILGKPI